jgi:hypothetical protein
LNARRKILFDITNNIEIVAKFEDKIIQGLYDIAGSPSGFTMGITLRNDDNRQYCRVVEWGSLKKSWKRIQEALEIPNVVTEECFTDDEARR